MQWKQFFTPVESIDVHKGHELFASTPKDELTILDVRQPGEYKKVHLPGSRLIPLPELNERLTELDPNKPTLVY
jgi:rhodanese-related sulfurtransferase